MYKNKGAQTQCSPCRRTHAQEGWQCRDRPRMITSRPSGPSPQISLSGSKSGLSLYANQPSFSPTNHGPPRRQPSSNHGALANNALQNQHQAQQETKEVRYHREQETPRLHGILSAPFSLSVYSTTLTGSKATANYFGQICWLDKFGWHTMTWRRRQDDG